MKKTGQQGISLIGTIFILVVLASVGVYLQKINAMQQTGVAISLQEKRVHYALQSGISWARSELLSIGGSCPGIGTTITIENVDVRLDACSQSNVWEGLSFYPVFSLSLSAQTKDRSFGDLDYVSRQVSLQIK